MRHLWPRNRFFYHPLQLHGPILTIRRHFNRCERILHIRRDRLNQRLHTLYEVFEPAEARRLVRKLEFHYTPAHGSWLNMAEFEIGVLSGQCLDRHIANITTLQREIAAWEEEHNARKATVDCQFTTIKARDKLSYLYPSKSI